MLLLTVHPCLLPADLAICRNPRYKLGPPCIREYLKRVSISEPTADFDTRNAVYAMKFHALLSVLYSRDGKVQTDPKRRVEGTDGESRFIFSRADRATWLCALILQAIRMTLKWKFVVALILSNEAH
jgi:hypothetical protein